MYSIFFGLRTNPFLPLSDPETILRSTQVKETLQHFFYARQNHHCIFLLTGEVGTGKTTAIRAAVGELPPGTPVIFLPPTISDLDELLDELFQALSLGGVQGSKAERRRRLERCLAGHAAEGRRAVVVVDEAHLLPDIVLEHLRLLTNVREGGHPVLQICLVGQPELATRLRADHLRQLRQRITLRYTMMPLDLRETELYLIERLRAAGARNPEAIFDGAAVRAIYSMTGGIPREINVVADQAMTNAFVSHEHVVRKAHLLSVESDYGFEGLLFQPSRVPAMELPAEPAPIAEEDAIGGAPLPLEPSLSSPETTLRTPRLRKVLDASARSVYWTARSVRLVPEARTAFILGSAVAGVVALLTAGGFRPQSAAATPPPAPVTPAAELVPADLSTIASIPVSTTPSPAPEVTVPPAEEPQKVQEERGAAVPAAEPVAKPAPKSSSAEPSRVEDRYPSTLEVRSGVPVVVWLGEERLGTAPGSFSPVRPGRYQVKLELADGRTFSKDIIMTPGSTTYVRANWTER